MLQDQLLYFPERATVAELAVGGLRAWPSAQEFRGLLAQPPVAARATAVVFHGNAGHAGHRAYYATVLARLAVRVVLAEYPGYGPRGGALGERSLVADAGETLQLALRHFGEPVIAIGESLGAGVAAAAVAPMAGRVAGVLLITPWDRLENVANFHYPWLPVSWFLRDRYDNAAHLASFGRPAVVAVAEHDRIVPAQFGEALFEALAQPKRFMLIRGVGHNDWPGRVDERWWREVIGFILGDGR
jgi:hypothetical protein